MIERGVILTVNNQQIGLEVFFPSLVEPSHPLNIIDKTGNLCETSSTTDANDLNQ